MKVLGGCVEVAAGVNGHKNSSGVKGDINQVFAVELQAAHEIHAAYCLTGRVEIRDSIGRQISGRCRGGLRGCFGRRLFCVGGRELIFGRWLRRCRARLGLHGCRVAG